MVTRKRVSLSLSESDFLHLSELAKIDGKLPTSLASDLLKAALSSRPIKTAFKPLKSEVVTPEPVIENKPVIPPLSEPSRPLSRQERRRLERMKNKKK